MLLLSLSACSAEPAEPRLELIGRIDISDVDEASELYRRLRALPGYGDEKAKIFIALLALGFVYAWRKGVFRWR